MTVENMAFSVDQVLVLTSLKKGRLFYWDSKDFFSPEYRIGRRRVYSFRDVVGLRTCAQLREEGVSLQEMRRVEPYLRQHHATPWSSLTIFRLGKKIYFRNPKTGQVEATDPLGQQAFDQVIELTRIVASVRAAIRRRRQRSAEQIGNFDRHRDVMSNALVFSGTRIPVSAVWSFHSDGYTVEQILKQYPTLTEADVQAGIDYERRQQSQRTRVA